MPKRKDYMEDNFIMSPKYDFVFKYLFGNEKHKDLLIAFLRDILALPEDDFEGIEIINSELLKTFKEDRKGILDVRVRTRLGKQIDVEIQILPTQYMAERTLFYWSKMYSGQIKPGDTYDNLKKCVTINIVDFECTPVKKLHSSYHITEDETGYVLTDILEVHFLEIPKLFDDDVEKNEEDPIVQWMEFIDGKSKGVMEMLAEKNKDIKKAYDLLQAISKDEKARMLYEAQYAEISDQRTRLKYAEEYGLEKGLKKGLEQGLEQGIKQGIEEGIKQGVEHGVEQGIDIGKFKVAENLLKMGLTNEQIASAAEIPLEKVVELRKQVLG